MKTLVAHPDVVRVLINRVWQGMNPNAPRPSDAEIMARAMFRLQESPYMAKHPTVRLDLHEPAPRFIEYEKSDEDWLRYFGYITPFEYEDTAQMLICEINGNFGFASGCGAEPRISKFE